MVIKLTTLTSQNPWWKSGDWVGEDPDIRKVKYLLDRREIDLPDSQLVLIRGVRRSGKTVYLKNLVKKLIDKGYDKRRILYLSCDRYTKGFIRNLISGDVPPTSLILFFL